MHKKQHPQLSIELTVTHTSSQVCMTSHLQWAVIGVDPVVAGSRDCISRIPFRTLFNVRLKRP